MIEFTLESAWGGWDETSIPDNLEITLRTNDTTHQMEASLRELLELYGMALHEREGTITVGTGKYIELERCNDVIRFRKPPLDIRTTFEELQDALEPLLAATFEAQDKNGKQDMRAEQLTHEQQRLRRHEIEYDVQALYNRFSEYSK